MKIANGFVDMTGRVCGRLTVVSQAPTPVGKKQAYWECRCECGAVKNVVGSDLRNGSSTSCGCIAREKASNRREDLTGKVFGRLTVLGWSEKRKSKNYWTCRCECGNVKDVEAGNLRAGVSTSCRSKDCKKVNYTAIHNRLYAERGPAKDFNCKECAKPAEEWAYSHNDPRELVSTETSHLGRPYSLDLTYYDPMCRSCHRKFDRNRG